MWSKISKLLQVGDVKDFWSKSSLFIFTNTWEAFFAKNWKKTNLCAETRKTLNFRVSTFSVPSGSRADLHPRPEGPSLRMDGMGWNIKSVLQISLYFVSRKNMFIPTYIYNILKNCYQHSYWFQNFMSSWGSWSKNSKLQQVGDFSFFGSTSSLLVPKVSFNYVYTFKVNR